MTVPASIGWIDDDLVQLESMATILEDSLSDGWKLVWRGPFARLEDYLEWLIDQGICALLVDQRLMPLSPHCLHQGHDLVKFINERMPTLPLFFVTAWDNESDVQLSGPLVFQVIPKKKLSDSASRAEVVARIERAARLYYNARELEHSRLSEIAEKASLGEATSEELREAEGISLRMWGHAPFREIQSRGEWLTQGEELLRRLDSLMSGFLLYSRRRTSRDAETSALAQAEQACC